jgi:hypothetical protein
MARLRGTGLGAGMALGTAAVVRTRSGIPMTPEVPPRIAELRAARRLTETPEVILVAEEYRTALALADALTWATVVGIAAARAEPDAPVRSLPAVVNIPSLMEAVEDDMLLLVDAERGLVLADPDGMMIAQYQAEREHIAPKRRIFLDDVHLPAKTIDGHTVQIAAWVETEADVADALAEGADALCAVSGSPLLPKNRDDASLRRDLFHLVDLTMGKSLLLLDSLILPTKAVLEAANRADITLVASLETVFEGRELVEAVQSLAETLKEAEAEILANDVAYSLPRLAADATNAYRPHTSEQDTVWIEALAAQGVTRLLLSLPYEDVERVLPGLGTVVSAAGANLLPVIVRLTGGFAFTEETLDDERRQAALRLFVGLGAAGIIVAPGRIQRTKAILRELNYSECRETLWQEPNGSEGSA